MADAQKKEIVTIFANKKILGANAEYARKVREILKVKQVFCINLISSPGSGKTTLLVETLQKLRGKINCAVIEGDQQTNNDAIRIAETGVPVVQINTMRSCHLNANQILEALKSIPLDEIDLLFIENVGNLVCPADVNLGEDEKIVLLSVTEGEDKPQKYPLAFSASDALIITKIDLLPHLRFDLESCVSYARSVKKDIRIIKTSCFSTDGLSEWVKYLESKLLCDSYKNL